MARMLGASAAPSILFGVVTDHSRDALELLKDNMAIVSFWPARTLTASWGVVVYNNKTKEWDELPAHARRTGSKLRMLEDGGLITRCKFYYQRRFARLFDVSTADVEVPGASTAPHPEYIWLLDNDISLRRFRMDRFLQSWSCSFPSGRPLIAQPVVLQNTQYFWPFNWKTWQDVATDTMVARPISFVEVQMPLVDGLFFRQFARGVGYHISERGARVNTDWGIDFVWCRAAQQYEASRQACAVVPTPISHENAQTYSKGKGYALIGKQTLRWIRGRWPELYFYPEGLGSTAATLPWKQHDQMRDTLMKELLKPRPLPESWHMCTVRIGAALEPSQALSNVHVYWINADPERRARMTRQFEELGIQAHTRVPATTYEDIVALQARGFNVSGLVLRRQVSSALRDTPRLATPADRITYSFSELGCTLSHLRAAHMVHKARHAFSLILEDDLDLGALRSWSHSLSELMSHAPNGWRVLQLHNVNAAQHQKFCGSCFAFWRWRKLFWSSAAYLLSREGAAALSGGLYTPETPAYPHAVAAFLTRQLHELNVQSPLVADNLIFRTNMPDAYTFSRPLFGVVSSTNSSIQISEVVRRVEVPLNLYLQNYFQPTGMSHCASLSATLHPSGARTDFSRHPRRPRR